MNLLAGTNAMPTFAVTHTQYDELIETWKRALQVERMAQVQEDMRKQAWHEGYAAGFDDGVKRGRAELMAELNAIKAAPAKSAVDWHKLTDPNLR